MPMRTMAYYLLSSLHHLDTFYCAETCLASSPTVLGSHLGELSDRTRILGGSWFLDEGKLRLYPRNKW